MGNWIKKILLLLPVLLVLGLCSGCSEEEAQSAYHIEYLNKEKTKLVKVPYDPQSSDTDALIQEFLTALTEAPEEVEYRKAIPGDVEILDYRMEGSLLTIYFNSDYSSMNPVEEVLCRAAVVRTMTQVAGINCVVFYVDGVPLTDKDGNMVGIMYEDSFIENPGEQINSIQSTTLTLYFSNENGDGLVEEVREEVYYNSNMSLDKLVMEQLLDGPQIEGAKAVIPKGTRIVNVSVVDGVCYVNLDDNFRNQDYGVSESVVIYAIVNSLTELPSINKVQISVNGDTSGVYRDSYKLADMYERDLSYIREETATEVEEITEEE